MQKNLPRLGTSPWNIKSSERESNWKAIKPICNLQMTPNENSDIFWGPELAVTTKRLLKSIERSKARDDKRMVQHNRTKNCVYSSSGSRNNIDKNKWVINQDDKIKSEIEPLQQLLMSNLQLYLFKI